MKDLGFIRWNSNSLHYASDSTYHYEGVNVRDILHIDSSAFLNIDSVIDKNTTFAREQYSTTVPCSFTIRTKTFYGRNVAFEKGITWLFNTSAQPYYYARLHFILGKKRTSDIASVFGYGGYGGFHAGLEAKIDFAKQYSFHVIDNYLFSGIATQSIGMGLYVKLVRKF